MSIVSLLIILVVIGVVIWAVTTYIPMDGGIKRLIQIVGVIIAVFIVLNAFGVFGSLRGVNVPTLEGGK